MLRATTACTFSTSQLPKVVRTWCVLHILTSKCASRHNGVQFFIAHLASWLRTRRFSEPTFRPSGATNHWKNTVFRDFPTFSRICIFFLPDSFSSDLLSSNLPLLSASALLCFSSLHIVGSLTSKLPSMNYIAGFLPFFEPSVDWDDDQPQYLYGRTTRAHPHPRHLHTFAPPSIVLIRSLSRLPRRHAFPYGTQSRTQFTPSFNPSGRQPITRPSSRQLSTTGRSPYTCL